MVLCFVRVVVRLDHPCLFVSLVSFPVQFVLFLAFLLSSVYMYIGLGSKLFCVHRLFQALENL